MSLHELVNAVLALTGECCFELGCWEWADHICDDYWDGPVAGRCVAHCVCGEDE